MYTKNTQLRSTEAEVILEALKSIQTSNNDGHRELKESFKEGLRGIRIQLASDNEIMNDHLKRINGTLYEHGSKIGGLEDESDKREKVVSDFYEFKGKFAWFKKGKNWLVMALIFIVCVIIVQFVYEVGMIGKILKMIVDKI